MKTMISNYTFSKTGIKNFEKLEPNLQKRITTKLNYWTDSGNLLGFADTIRKDPHGTHRLRVGDYRIIFQITDSKILITKVGHRSEIYK